MLKKLITTIFVIGLLSFIVISVVTLCVFGVFDKYYSEEELVSHYLENQVGFLELINHYKTIVPSDKIIEIEFEDYDKLFRFGITEIDTIRKSRSPMYLEWDLNIDDDISLNLLDSINWDRNTFSELKSKLDAVGCVQIENGNPTKIGFKRAGFGLYSYFVFDVNSSSDFMNNQRARNDIYFVSELVAWNFDSGALH